MENLLCIKGKIIGKGKPIVCVPVMESSKEEILREKYNIDNIFKERSNYKRETVQKETKQITKYKESFLKKILNRIKIFFKK